MPIPLGIFAVAGASAVPAVPAYELIATSISTGIGVVTFSSIPQTYKHLEVRANAFAGGDSYTLRVNGSSSVLYTQQAVLYYFTGESDMILGITSNPGTFMRISDKSSSSLPASFITSILDYTSTTKTKTFRTITGQVSGSNSNHSNYSGLFNSTSAITSLTFSDGGSNGLFNGSRVSLYGIKG
jgi:hypothetical protein